MKCTVRVYLLNEHFSQEHADANFEGKPSANNRKFDWEDELEITSEVDHVEEIEDASFPLQGVLPDGESFHHEVQKMHLFEIMSSGLPSTYVGCSKSILDSAKIEKRPEGFNIEIYIRDYEPLANPIPGIYIASKEFPKALIF